MHLQGLSEAAGIGVHYRFLEYHDTKEVIYNALEAESEGYDAFLIGNISDAGIREAREVVKIQRLRRCERSERPQDADFHCGSHRSRRPRAHRAGMSPEPARIVADHLVDANLCGHEFSSLPRVLAIADELRKKPPPGEIRVVREDRCSAVIDGGDNIAYVVSITAIDKAIEICRKMGVAVVAANNTWFSGRLAYYVERAARQG